MGFLDWLIGMKGKEQRNGVAPETSAVKNEGVKVPRASETPMTPAKPQNNAFSEGNGQAKTADLPQEGVKYDGDKCYQHAEKLRRSGRINQAEAWRLAAVRSKHSANPVLKQPY